MLLRTYLPFLGLACLLFFTACNKEEDPVQEEMTIEEAETSVIDVVVMDKFTEDVDDAINGLAGGSGGTNPPCLNKIVEENQFMMGDVFVKARMVDIQFAPDGCEAPNGFIYEGNIIYRCSLFYNDPMLPEFKESRSLNYNCAIINDVELCGVTSFQTIWDTLFIIDKSLAFSYPNGQTSGSTAYYRYELEDFNTPNPGDDEVIITGGSDGTNRKGQSFEYVITPELRRSVDCSYIDQGTAEFYIGAFPNPAVINYGDGSCDPMAVVTLPNGNTKTIEAKPWW
jgi:hypothetical protein